MYATIADAHHEWHQNTGIPIGTPGCPQDACHLPDPYCWDCFDEDPACSTCSTIEVAPDPAWPSIDHARSNRLNAIKATPPSERTPDMKIVFAEWYGRLSFAQRAAYRKFNVSPSDHDLLVDEFGASEHAKITAAVKARSASGMYTAPWPTRWS